MNRKKLLELSCGTALIITMLCSVLLQPRAVMNNWWGVVFSPLCNSAVTEETEGEEYVLKWKTLEWIEKWLASK